MNKSQTKPKQNINIYKLFVINNIRMFPSDPTGSLDDFFLRSYLNYGGFYKRWKRL